MTSFFLGVLMQDFHFCMLVAYNYPHSRSEIVKVLLYGLCQYLIMIISVGNNQPLLLILCLNIVSVLWDLTLSLS